MKQSSKKKILIFLPDAFGGKGGMSKFYRDFLKALSSYSMLDTIVAMPRLIIDEIEKKEIPDKVNYSVGGANSKIKYILNALFIIFSKSSCKLVVCGHINLLPIAYFASIVNRSPLLLIIHGIEVWNPSSKKFSNFIIQYLDGVISVSSLNIDRFSSWANVSNAKKFILPNSIDCEIFFPGKRSINLINKYHIKNKIILLSMGRLVSEERFKGFDEVLEVLPDLIAIYPNIVYLIAGDGPDRTRLENKVKSLNLDDYVIFLGWIYDDLKVEYLRLADAFLMPSRGEGFGIVLLEAMACGIPVLGSKLDGTSEALLMGELGILVDPTNCNDVKSGILLTLKNPKKVPEKLSTYSIKEFIKCCHHILDHYFI
ncbi:glycosyltransferase family 4 protein [Acaryochloris marina NIES-2412]|uniref:glycosyltransferase family 4 protein n=1 Tax=Acaryochloris marina TaxID=155978 RepID=UPI0040582080